MDGSIFSEFGCQNLDVKIIVRCHGCILPHAKRWTSGACHTILHTCNFILVYKLRSRKNKCKLSCISELLWSTSFLCSQLALRVPPAVIRLTVNCWLHIPVSVWFVPTLARNHVWGATCYLCLTLDIVDRFSWNWAWITRNGLDWLIFAVTLPPMFLRDSYGPPREEMCATYFQNSWIAIFLHSCMCGTIPFLSNWFAHVSLLNEFSKQ